MNRSKEAILSAIVQDRIPEIHKLSNELSAGCVYYALISAYNFLYPHKPLPKDIEKLILSTDQLTEKKNLKVFDYELLTVIDNLEPHLKLKLAEIKIPLRSPENVTDIKNIFEVPKQIPVKKKLIFYVKTRIGKYSEVLLLKNNSNIAHFLHTAKDFRLNDTLSTCGGNDVFNFYLDRGYLPYAVFRFEKSNVNHI